MIVNLFSNLSKRLRSENNLSDITWALAETFHEFKEKVMKFFFPELKDCKNVEITREKILGGSRPDFFAEFDGKNFVIENKIENTNYHFQQYADEAKKLGKES